MQDVSGDAYFPAVHAALNAATGSITVAMYQMRVPEMATPGQPVRALVDDLVAAQRRGVDVKVVLDRSQSHAPRRLHHHDRQKRAAIDTVVPRQTRSLKPDQTWPHGLS